jgi:hypothetical protein
MKEAATRNIIHWFMLHIYILIVMIIFLKYLFVIALEAIRYVIDSIWVVKFLTCIFSIA